MKDRKRNEFADATPEALAKALLHPVPREAEGQAGQSEGNLLRTGPTVAPSTHSYSALRLTMPTVMDRTLPSPSRGEPLSHE